MDKKDFKSLIDIEKDIIKHPEKDLKYLEKGALLRKEFTEADMLTLQNAFKKIVSNPSLTEKEKKGYMLDSWKVNFNIKPPSPQEFLSNDWIGPVSNSVYPYIKKFFYDYFDPSSTFRDLILYLPIGIGKSFLSVLINLYIGTHYYLMRNPRKFLGTGVTPLSETAVIVMVLIAFNQDKAYEILTKPLINALSTSERYVRCKTEEILNREIAFGDQNKIYWTTAGDGTVLQIGDLRFIQVSDISRLLGLSILSATATELAFFKQKAWSDEKIMQLFNDTKGRIYSRFGKNYYARTILDSSPNTLENSIDSWIVNESWKDKYNLLLRGTKWEFQPDGFPEWSKDKSKVFPVYKGTASSRPKIITPEQKSQYDVTDIIEMPIDIKQLATDDLDKVLKDYAGIPSGDKDKLMNVDTIDRIFVPNLINEYSYMFCPSRLPPETILWDAIKDKYFLKIGSGESDYQFYRFPSAQRFLSFDQSYAKDWTGISMCHIEINKKTGEPIYVIDFSISIAVGPKKSDRINLEAFKFFAYCLRRYGNIKFGKISYDGFQSVSSLQYLERHNFEVEKLSVDIDTEPYLNFIALSTRGCVKMGRNIVMKNNLKSLVMAETKVAKKKKIDHLIGDVSIEDLANDKWESSKIGYYAKDLSDAVVGSIALAERYGNKKHENFWEDPIDNINEVIYNQTKESIYNDIEKIYGLKSIIRN